MFVTIRRYSPKNGAINRASLDLLRRQLRDEFVPTLRKVSGFAGYYVLSVGDRELITLSFCETKEGAVESNRCSAEYTLRNPLVYELGRPEVTECEVLASSQPPAETATKSASGTGAAEAALALWFQESGSMLLTASER